jgi:hypothetical protein
MKSLKLILICYLFLHGPAVVGTHGSANLKGAGPGGCNNNSRVLETVHQGAARDQLIIVIARPGAGDVRRNLNRRRLHNVLAYWTRFLKGGPGRKPETIILAEAERVSGRGRLEFYVGGKLYEVLDVERNRDLIAGECYPPDESYISRSGVFDACRVAGNKIFYPCLDRNVLRRSSR